MQAQSGLGPLAFTLVSLSLACCARSQAAKEASTVAPSQLTTIHQELDFDCPPARLYQSLLDGNQFGALTGAPAQISPDVGGAFSAFGGHIAGRNIELVSNQRIVQAWRAAGWPAGAYSTAHFELIPRGTGTHLVFDHAGFPEGQHDHLAEGWESHYWASLRKCAR